MPQKDIQDVAHCVYMIDLVLREIMTAPHITNKAFATRSILECFVRIFREEGYGITEDRLKKMLAYAH